MKRFVASALLASTLFLGATTARAIEQRTAEYEDSMLHPLRIAAYLIHPFGYAAEWLIGRPFHYIISRPGLDRIFGYQSQQDQGSFRRYGDQI